MEYSVYPSTTLVTEVNDVRLRAIRFSRRKHYDLRVYWDYCECDAMCTARRGRTRYTLLSIHRPDRVRESFTYHVLTCTLQLHAETHNQYTDGSRHVLVHTTLHTAPYTPTQKASLMFITYCSSTPSHRRDARERSKNALRGKPAPLAVEIYEEYLSLCLSDH